LAWALAEAILISVKFLRIPAALLALGLASPGLCQEVVRVQTAQSAVPAPPLRLILAGPPGSGKSTFAARLAEDFGLAHVSVGDLLRKKAGSDPGLAAVMARGELVPSGVVMSVVSERLSRPDARRGFILDGFPRRLEEARSLKSLSPVDAMIRLDVPEGELLRRILARGRADDTEEVFRRRMRVFREETLPALRALKGEVEVLRAEVSDPDVEKSYAKVRTLVEGLAPRQR
jgi:adenylate kinase